MLVALLRLSVFHLVAVCADVVISSQLWDIRLLFVKHCNLLYIGAVKALFCLAVRA
jgi:hypothetical protein